MPKTSSGPSNWTFVTTTRWRWSVALSFLCMAFVRMLQVARPTLQPADRAVLAGLSRLRTVARRGRFSVQPETLLRWHRELMRRKWAYSNRRPGRPASPPGTVSLVLRLARENPTWGYRRTQGELATMGVRLAPSSVWAILRRHSVEPPPRRSGSTPGGSTLRESPPTRWGSGQPSRLATSPRNFLSVPGHASFCEC